MDIEFKNAIFTFEHIIIKKRKSYIIIPLNNVNELFYAKPSIKNYFKFSCTSTQKSVGVLYIYLNEKIKRKKMYCFFIKYSELIQVPENIFKKIKLYI